LAVVSENLPVLALSGISGQIVLNSMRVNLELEQQINCSAHPHMEMGDVYGIKRD